LWTRELVEALDKYISTLPLPGRLLISFLSIAAMPGLQSARICF
jgi:hypothetical protein